MNNKNPYRTSTHPTVIIFGIIILCTGTGCLPERIDKTTNMKGEPLKALMNQVGKSLEMLEPPDGGEGRVINEFKNLWHYLNVSSSTSLIFLRSRYTGVFSQKETVIARFENSAFGTIDINAEIEGDSEHMEAVHAGYIKFTASVTNPSPGTARAEIYPFPREYNGEKMPPSLQMVLPPSFVVPSNSHIDHRKKYMKDQQSMDRLQQFVQAVYIAGKREVSLP